MATTSTQIPADDTIPQNTEGAQLMAATIDTSKNITLLIVRAQALLSSASASTPQLTHALFKDAVADALAAASHHASATDKMSMVSVGHAEIQGNAGSITFKSRGGANASPAVTFNGSAGARVFGGVASSYLEIDEVMI